MRRRPLPCSRSPAPPPCEASPTTGTRTTGPGCGRWSFARPHALSAMRTGRLCGFAPRSEQQIARSSWGSAFGSRWGLCTVRSTVSVRNSCGNPAGGHELGKTGDHLRRVKHQHTVVVGARGTSRHIDVDTLASQSTAKDTCEHQFLPYGTACHRNKQRTRSGMVKTATLASRTARAHSLGAVSVRRWRRLVHAWGTISERQDVVRPLSLRCTHSSKARTSSNGSPSTRRSLTESTTSPWRGTSAVDDDSVAPRTSCTTAPIPKRPWQTVNSAAPSVVRKVVHSSVPA